MIIGSSRFHFFFPYTKRTTLLLQPFRYNFASIIEKVFAFIFKDFPIQKVVFNDHVFAFTSPQRQNWLRRLSYRGPPNSKGKLNHKTLVQKDLFVKKK